MPAETLPKNERTASQPVPARTEDELREWARRHVARVRKLKRDAAVYVLGMIVLTAVWVLVEWNDNGRFERLDFSDDGTPGDWEPWILYVALIWGFFVALDALRVYFDRPATEAEVDRTLERMRSSR